MSEPDELDEILMYLHNAWFEEDYDPKEINVLEAKAAIQALITKELREVIGEDENDNKFEPGSQYYEIRAFYEVNRNNLRAEQRQRAKAKGYDV